MPVEWYEILGGKITRNGYRQREDKGVPVGSKGLAGIADVGNAADVGGEDGHAHHPARNGVACGGELIGAAALLEERAAEHHDTQREDDKDDEINQMHCFFFLTTNYTNYTNLLLQAAFYV